MHIDPKTEKSRLKNARVFLETAGWTAQQGWLFKAPGGTVHDLSAADLSQLARIEEKGLFRAFTPRPRSAVCLAVMALDRTFLGISRRNDDSQWGFPGGKVDPGETNLQSIVRECSEELGWDFDPERMEPLYSGLCPGKGPDDTYWVTTYLYQGEAPAIADLRAEAGMALDWLSREQLCDTAASPFAGYNQAAFASLDQYQYQGKSA